MYMSMHVCSTAHAKAAAQAEVVFLSMCSKA